MLLILFSADLSSDSVTPCSIVTVSPGLEMHQWILIGSINATCLLQTLFDCQFPSQSPDNLLQYSLHRHSLLLIDPIKTDQSWCSTPPGLQTSDVDQQQLHWCSPSFPHYQVSLEHLYNKDLYLCRTAGVMSVNIGQGWLFLLKFYFTQF